MLLKSWLEKKSQGINKTDIWEDYFCDESALPDRENKIYVFLRKINNDFLLNNYYIHLANIQTSYGTFERIRLEAISLYQDMFSHLIINIKNPIPHTQDYELTFYDNESKISSSNENSFIKILNSLLNVGLTEYEIFNSLHPINSILSSLKEPPTFNKIVWEVCGYDKRYNCNIFRRIK